MKKSRNALVVIIAIIAGIFFLSESLFGFNLKTLIMDDTKAPVIDTSNLVETVSVDQTYVVGEVTCTDNLDSLCEVTITGSIDTSVVGEQTLTLKATDLSGNEAVIEFTVTVIEGLNTMMYVPAGYYDGIDGLSGEALKNALNDIITNHTEFPYTATSTDVWDMLREADEDPENPDNVIMFYSGFSWPKECQDTTTPPDYCYDEIDGETKQVEWNREHIWSKSRGDFEHEDGSSSLALGAHTDGHHLVAAERRMNSLKNNRHFEDCNDGDDTNIVERAYGNYTCNDWEFEPRDEVKGDVARMLFYMAVRYEGEDGDYVDLELKDDPDSSKDNKSPYYGDLSDLLRWHLEDPVDEWELERNQTIYTYQGNRNPFIDMPELVELIWGTEASPIEYVSTTE